MESIWKDPLKFDPGRFSQEAEKKNPFAFVPFSAGSRNCIGQKFAMLEVKSLLAKLLLNFKWSKKDGFEPKLIADLVLRSENGIMLTAETRNKVESN